MSDSMSDTDESIWKIRNYGPKYAEKVKKDVIILIVYLTFYKPIVSWHHKARFNLILTFNFSKHF